MVVTSLTIAVASFQRREPLARLLRTLDEQAAEVPDAPTRLDIVVVLDGSTDGSCELVTSLRMGVPVQLIWQPNGGLASARNAALAAAAREIIWFLDDDLVPCPGLVARHRAEHQAPPAHLLLGPCKPMASTQAGEAWVRWWDEHYAELERTGFVDRFDRFTVANLSGPTEWFRSVGGFDASFFGYGCEDYELGVRMLGRGVVVRFDPEAAAWHDHAESEAVAIARKRSLGRNMVRVAKLHPETTTVLFPAEAGPGHAPPGPPRLPFAARPGRHQPGGGLPWRDVGSHCWGATPCRCANWRPPRRWPKAWPRRIPPSCRSCSKGGLRVSRRADEAPGEPSGWLRAGWWQCPKGGPPPSHGRGPANGAAA